MPKGQQGADQNDQTDDDQNQNTDQNSQTGNDDSDSNDTPELDPKVLLAQAKKNAAEAKKYRQNLASTKAELEDLKRKQTEKDGNWQELAAQREKELTAEKGKTTKLLNSFGQRLVSEAVEREASRLNAKYPEAVIALLDISEIEVDEELKVDSTLVKAKIEELRKKMPDLFKKADPKIHNVNGNRVVETGKKNLDQMKPDELLALLKTMK